jgi:pimeloyl-ACP methyl ester carboxylesterase
MIELIERRVLAGLDPSESETGAVYPFPAECVRDITTPDEGWLHVEECGTGAPILLLHGHGASLGTFAPLAGRLAAGGHRVVAVDLRGFGRSSPVPADFEFDGLVDDVALVLEALDLDDVILVGHSMGGAVALGVAVSHARMTAERVRGLVLLNSTARGPADRWLNRMIVRVQDWQALERLGRHPRHGVVLSRNNFGTGPRRRDVEVARSIGLESPIEPRRGFARRLLGTDLSADLALVEVPVLALAGDSDRVVSARESIRLVDLLPDARLEVYPGAGHMLPLERVDAVADQILRFASHIGGPTAP